MVRFTCRECGQGVPGWYYVVTLDMCVPCARPHRKEYQIKQYKAKALFNKEIKEGRIERKKICELCGRPGKRITGHHWRGYEGDAAIDCWQICNSCNSVLQGRRFHDGSVSKEEARVIVLERLLAKAKAELHRKRRRAIKAETRTIHNY